MSESCTAILADEQAMHGDLIFLQVEETYYAITRKVPSIPIVPLGAL